MISRNIALSLLLAILLAVLWGNNQNNRIESRLDALEGEIQYCVWEYRDDDGGLRFMHRAIKGTKQAERAVRDIGRPSDKGDC